RRSLRLASSGWSPIASNSTNANEERDADTVSVPGAGADVISEGYSRKPLEGVRLHQPWPTHSTSSAPPSSRYSSLASSELVSHSQRGPKRNVQAPSDHRGSSSMRARS